MSIKISDNQYIYTSRKPDENPTQDLPGRVFIFLNREVILNEGLYHTVWAKEEQLLSKDAIAHCKVLSITA
ncbi:hypothetical protein F7734_49320 [Scytonema sp. UIC 10036]|uniref:hypothetical protein n=1 Tax=Scytonema sp. UIC 10036 TaxID=2304196 RepID=UPI0012DA8C94|nr:hypothetical protein [Scytonema sp. UIC 10036]MUG99856.1 hypothetical protein [Scytonema sp. UIC 10036]